jgi:chromosome segregation ATPase
LLSKNNKMKAQIEILKRDIEIHKEVEKELAKRSHFCQKVIKRLKTEVKELEAQKNDILHKKGLVTNMRGALRDGAKVEPLNEEANDDMVNYLEQKLEDIEKRLAATQSEYETLQNDYMELQDKMNQSREKYKRAALLLTDFLDDMLTATPNILSQDKDMNLDMEKM